MRGILINPFDETVKEVVYSGDYHEIYYLTDCTTFDVVRLSDTDDMYVDDEGLLKNSNRYFSLFNHNFAGKALLLGHDDEGETTATQFTVEDIKKAVSFLPEGHREEPYMEFTVWK